jgi:hypothetical protein
MPPLPICPLCGKPLAWYQVDTEPDQDDGWWGAECGCGLSLTYDELLSSTAPAPRRPAMPAPEPQLELIGG